MLTGPALRARRTVSRPLGCPRRTHFLKRSRTLAPWSEADQAGSRKYPDLRWIAYLSPASGTRVTRSVRGARGSRAETSGGRRVARVTRPRREGDGNVSAWGTRPL